MIIYLSQWMYIIIIIISISFYCDHMDSMEKSVKILIKKQW